MNKADFVSEVLKVRTEKDCSVTFLPHEDFEKFERTTTWKEKKQDAGLKKNEIEHIILRASKKLIVPWPLEGK